MIISTYINSFQSLFPEQQNMLPWEFIDSLAKLIGEATTSLDHDYMIRDGIAIHLSAQIEPGAVIKSPAIIQANCFVGANAYLRGGVFLAPGVSVGPGVEIKTSILCSGTSAAHFNFIGDSLIGSEVNFEAGSVVANHYNERKEKQIIVVVDNKMVDTGTKKFGALVGDGSKIGANAVLSPGTILLPGSIVKRLELVEQVKN